MKTKDKIISEATKAFNENGFGAVSLQELAQKTGISRGNLTYHFKDKEALLQAISDKMWGQMREEKEKSRSFPSFENLHNVVQLYYKMQLEYAFIFLDTHVLNHPIIKSKFRAITKETLEDNKAAIAFSIQLGNLKPELIPGTYHNIGFLAWMIIFFWLPQQIIRGKKTGDDGAKMIWSLLVPHMTEKGIISFKKFYGEAYYNSLGESFEVDAHSFISF